MVLPRVCFMVRSWATAAWGSEVAGGGGNWWTSFREEEEESWVWGLEVGTVGEAGKPPND